ncbi:MULTISPECIES: AEC family transporter [Acinetobacter]|uniref:AEC family transporter n=1 Tax=Acinetobacter TaxID=469 RepID=UPI00019ADDBC|nr:MULTISPECIES: AEC family transporter [Acinetobacter]EEH70021.1 transporter, auxin efflux carrier (AEC) family protein [Acinetobacter sp. ATCC 27244]NAR51699.1 AEC family transporter [Acinetobacter haemolyticus]NAR54967.1 AEC family transporter [Acinetobacter haemolyticus]NAR61965.1 AEC family transporter [Acinetobacter haemolyticus]NAR67798.1 AEC family transporter [Acinetobacter haemolyticus]
MNSIILALFPLVALIASGYLFKKYHFLSQDFWAGAEKLNYYILFPALLFNTLSTTKVDFQSLSTAIFAMFFVALLVTASMYVLRMFWNIQPARFGVHVQSLVRFNTYIGLALVASLFQKEGMAILVILLALCIPLVNVISVLALTSKEQMAVKPVLIALLKNPLIVSCIVGGVVNVLNIPIWDGLSGLIKLFSASSLPLGLLCVGAALQFMQMKKDIVVLVADTFARLLAVPALAFVVCTWLGLPSLQTQILVVFFALPTASAAYILTKVLGGDSQLMAAVISFQTLCAAVTLPIMIWWVS